MAQSGAAPAEARPHKHPARPAPRGGSRNRNTGIWKSISLYATDKAAIRNPFIRSELAKPGYDKAEETVSVEVINPTTGSVKCVVAGEITGENIRFSKRDKPFSWRNS